MESSHSLEDDNNHSSDSEPAYDTFRVDLTPGACLRITIDEQIEDKDNTQKTAVEIRCVGGTKLSWKVDKINHLLETPSDSTGVGRQKRSIRDRVLMRLKTPIPFSDLQWQYILFFIGLAIYAVTRFIGLADFPIYFFTDEAVQAVLAADFIRDGFHNYSGEFLPTFFVNNTLYCLSTSVYLQVIPVILFGKSVLVTRATAALVTVFSAIWISLIIRDVFKMRIWWSAALFLSITPAWFLHSRTAFEYGLLVTFYTGFLYYYWLYRCKNPRYLYAALFFGALAFYSYMPGQIIMVVSGLLLLGLDWRYHWQERSTTVRGAGVLMLVSLPFVRFLLLHPDEMTNRLNRYQSYWQTAISLQVKMTKLATEYIAGLNPLYWFLANDYDLCRHVMKGYGHILLPMLPLSLIGLFFVLKYYWKREARPVITALLAAPSGSAVIALGITRSLVMVIPVVLLSVIGASKTIDWLNKKTSINIWVLDLTLLVLLAGFNGFMLQDALVNAPLWYENYGLSGMQYGARQVFKVVQEYLDQSPSIHMDVSPTWTNGADVVARFFLGDPLPIEMASIESYTNQHRVLNKNHLFVMTPEEYQRTVASRKFKNIEIERIIPYPDGTAGFYFVRLLYVDEIDAILMEEKEQRSQLREASLSINGHPAQVKFSYLDMGNIQHVFDGNDQTLARTMEANPMVVRVDYLDPIEIKNISVYVGGGPTRVLVKMMSPYEGIPVIYQEDLPPVPNPRSVDFSLKQKREVISLQIEVQNLDVGEPSHVHVWEIRLD